MSGILWKKIVKIRNGFEIELCYLMEYNKKEYNKIRTGTTAAQAASWFRGEMFEEEKNMVTNDATILRLKHDVLYEVAKAAWEGNLEEERGAHSAIVGIYAGGGDANRVHPGHVLRG